jgi:hypothetical protein
MEVYIGQGEDSLTPKQQVVWEKGIIPALKNRDEELEVQGISSLITFCPPG